jgi:acetylornithine deacetylase/succinyl-diaminopimelate desuccinylase-like protein
LTAEGFKMVKPEKRLDYGSLLIPKDRLRTFEAVVQEVLGDVKCSDISKAGYGEAQLLNEKFGVDCVYFGPGPKETGHQVDEYVSITELQQVSEVFRRLIERFCY